jgi:hypothetical protein
MAAIKRSCAALRIFGDALVPGEISRLLGCEPTMAHAKGDELPIGKAGNVRIARSGMWRLLAEDREPEDLNGQIEDILGRLSGDLTVWAALGKSYGMEIFCGIFMSSSNDGMQISSGNQLALGQRGIGLVLDIYDPVEERTFVPPEPGEHTLVIREKPYFSYLDEKHFFTWLESLEDVMAVRGTAKGLCIDLRERYLSKSGAYDLIALLTRYGYPLSSIAPRINPADDDYFRRPDARWYEEIYGRGES